jgi:hypothetical protein
MAHRNDDITGHKVTHVRPMTKKELAEEGWDDHRGVPVVLVFSNGTKLYASQDDEGNGPGALFGVDPSGDRFAL